MLLPVFARHAPLFDSRRWIRGWAGLTVGLLLTGCVTGKRYDDLKARADQDVAARQQAEQQAQRATTDVATLQQQLGETRKRLNRLAGDSLRDNTQLAKERAAHADLETAYEKLLHANDRMLANSATDLEKANRDLNRRESELRAAEKQNTELSASLKAREDSVNALSGRLKAREARVKSLEKTIADKDKAVSDLRQRVAAALTGFSGQDLTVQIKNGKVYVSLSEQLLFNSGSARVDPKGADALRKLATALAAQKDVNVLIEGHTDDVPIKGGTAGMRDNWDLSVLRATEIARLLTTGGVAPERVTAAGRSQYVPVVANTSKETRQQNRRTEIILTPKLDELFKLLE